MSTPYLSRYTLKFCTRADAVTNVFFPPPPGIWVIVFLDVRVLRDPTFPDRSFRERLGRCTLNTCAKKIRVYISKTSWTFGLLCGKVKKSLLGIVITWVQRMFDFGR